jgi:hypothetical protein
MYLFSGELDNSNYNALMPVKEKESMGILDKIYFLCAAFAENNSFRRADTN